MMNKNINSHLEFTNLDIITLSKRTVRSTAMPEFRETFSLLQE